MSPDFFLLTHIQYLEKKSETRGAGAALGIYFSLTAFPFFPSVPIHLGTTLNSQQIWETWVSTRPSRALYVGLEMKLQVWFTWEFHIHLHMEVSIAKSILTLAFPIHQALLSNPEGPNDRVGRKPPFHKMAGTTFLVILRTVL